MTIWFPDLDDRQPAYRSLAEALARDLATGKVAPGDRLPTQRDLARALGVSVGTVTRAYALAERRGLLHGEVGRGTFVGAPSTPALPVGDLGESVDGAINLSMTWPLAGHDPDLASALRRLGRDPDVGDLLAYQPNAGCERHRAAGSRWLRRYGVEAPAARVVVCAGAQHAMTVALGTLLGPGDGLLCEELTYPGIRAAAKFQGLDLVGLACDDEGLCPEAFERAARDGRGRVLYTVPTLQNPTAATQSSRRREAIVDIARRHGAHIIEDAVHHLLLDAPPPTLASLAPDVTTLIAAPSKVVAGGLRVGFLAAPVETIPRIVQAVWSTMWMVSPLCVELFARWIDDGTADRTVAAKREEAAARAALAREVLGDADIVLVPGAYHAWLRLPPERASAAAFAAEAQRNGVLVTGAEAFLVRGGDAPAAVRVSLSAPRSRETLRVGLERLAATLRGVGAPIV